MSRTLALAGAGILAAYAVMPATPAFSQSQAITGPGGAPASFADIVEAVKPAVVSIRVSSSARRLASRQPSQRNQRPRREGRTPFPDLPGDHPLNEFFKNMPRGFGNNAPQRRQPQRRARAQGSGFVISEDGFVVTNNHVIRGGSQITVVFDEKTKYDAKLVGADPRTDLALLKIQSDKKFKYVKFANKKSRVGDWVVAVGNPFGLGGTVTAGIVSAHGRNIGSGPYDFIQIDAAVNRGNSGGPTFNLGGDVIGVNTAIYSPSGGNVGIAFAVPAATAVEVIEQLKKSGSVSRGWLGVKIQSVTEDMAASLGLSGPQGALINEVTAGGPAEKAGFQAGDAILTVEGQKIEDSRDLARKIAAFNPGSTVNVKVRRASGDADIKVKLGTFPGAQKQAEAKPEAPKKKAKPTALKDLGLGLVAAPSKEKGVAIDSVEDNSDAAEKGLQKGDIIVAVNSQNVAKPADVDKVVQEAKKLGRKAVLVTLKRGDTRRFVAIQLKSKG